MRILYQIKRLLLKKGILFWTIAFPIFLGGLFFAMFSNLSAFEKFSEIPIGLVKTEPSTFFDTAFETILQNVKMDESSNMFQVTIYSSEKEASAALKDDRIDGYILLEKDYPLTVKESSVQTSVINIFLNQYKTNIGMIQETALKNPKNLIPLILNLFQHSDEQIQNIDLKGTDKDVYSQYFYAALAMTCLLMSSLGLQIGIGLQADLSPLGARRNIAPTPKMKMIFDDLAAVLLLSFAMFSIVFLTFATVYKRDFGPNIPLLLLSSYIGCFTGVSAGMVIAVLIKGPVSKKEALCTTFFMSSSFLGGLQWGDITYLLEQNCPLINRINPATLIVNAYQSLAVFDDMHQYFINVATLFFIGCVFFFISIFKLRRTKYANI